MSDGTISLLLALGIPGFGLLFAYGLVRLADRRSRRQLLEENRRLHARLERLRNWVDGPQPPHIQDREYLVRLGYGYARGEIRDLLGDVDESK